MEQALNSLINACNDKNCLTYKNFNQLNIGEYKIKRFALSQTKFGLRVKAISDDFYIYLPTKFTNHLNKQEQIDALNDGNVIMWFKGKDRDGVHLEFKQQQEQQQQQ